MAQCAALDVTFPSLFFAGCATLPPVKIRARKNPSGVTVYQLDLGLIDGRRVRQTFQNKADAQSALVRARAKVASEGINALIPPAPEHPNLAKWMLRLEGTGKTLDDVFRWFFATYQEQKSVPLPEALLSTYRIELARLNRTQKYIHQSLATLNVFFAAVPRVTDVSRDNVVPFIQGNGYSPATQQNKLVTLKAFLEWCVSVGHLQSNPLSGAANRIRIPKTQKTEILSLGYAEARELLKLVLTPRHEALAGWLTLALFAGIRPDEIVRTGREWLHLEEGTLRVTAKASKTSQTRVIELSPVALAWLRHWSTRVQKDAPFTISGHRKRWERLKEEAGVAHNWVHDALRHTFATMHYAAHQNAAQLKALMGHSQGENTLFSHYRAVQTVSGATVTRAMALEFWDLFPERLQGAGKGKVR